MVEPRLEHIEQRKHSAPVAARIERAAGLADGVGLITEGSDIRVS
jgi:hypothetical protein